MARHTFVNADFTAYAHVKLATLISHVVLPLPVGPIRAFNPGRMMPLMSRRKHTYVRSIMYCSRMNWYRLAPAGVQDDFSSAATVHSNFVAYVVKGQASL